MGNQRSCVCIAGVTESPTEAFFIFINCYQPLHMINVLLSSLKAKAPSEGQKHDIHLLNTIRIEKAIRGEENFQWEIWAQKNRQGAEHLYRIVQENDMSPEVKQKFAILSGHLSAV